MRVGSKVRVDTKRHGLGIGRVGTVARFNVKDGTLEVWLKISRRGGFYNFRAGELTAVETTRERI